MITILKNKPLKGKHQRPIVTDQFYNDDGKLKPVVIFCHGYKGFKDWGPWDLVGNAFAENNYFFVKFNFSHNGGTLDNPIDFPDLEAFGRNNFSIELDDLETIIDWVETIAQSNANINANSISLIGHSRGGGIVTLKAAEDSRVTNIISWAGVSDFGARFPSGKELELWKKHGVAYIENGRTKQQMPHYIQFYENFIQNQERFNIENACKQMKANHLIIHGDNDEVVPEIEAKNVHSWSENSKLHLIGPTGHTFDAMHPWENDNLPEQLEIVVQSTLGFLDYADRKSRT